MVLLQITNRRPYNLKRGSKNELTGHFHLLSEWHGFPVTSQILKCNLSHLSRQSRSCVNDAKLVLG